MNAFLYSQLEPETQLEPKTQLEPDSQYDPRSTDHSRFARMALGSVPATARASVVNRTHRVVRHRARVMQARRSHVRGLMVPLVLCSIFLILTVIAVWSGLYQAEAAEAAEAVQANVAAALAATDSDHFVVALLWFVPVSITVLGAILLRRARSGVERETAR